MKYTIDLVFWNPDTCSVCVEAPSVVAAIKRAYEIAWEGGSSEPCAHPSDWYETTRSQETVMDCASDTAIAGIARGRHDCVFDAPEGAKLSVPFADMDPLWEPGKPDGIVWRRAQIKRLEAEIAKLIEQRAAKTREGVCAST